MGVRERVGAAISGGDLDPRHHSVEEVAALGMAGGARTREVLERKHNLERGSIQPALADAIYRLKYGGEAREYKASLAAVKRLALGLAKRDGRKQSAAEVEAAATEVLHYWLFPLCEECHGRGYEAAEGAPHLTDRACRACGGTRRKREPWFGKRSRRPDTRNQALLESWRASVAQAEERIALHRTILVTLEELERELGREIQSRLR